VSTEPAPDPIAAARAALDRVIVALRGDGLAENPGLLLRIGRLETRLAAAEALYAPDKSLRLHEHAAEAELLAVDILRDLTRDFGEPQPALGLVEQDARHRNIAHQYLTAGDLP
jgi:hypothetical protein